MLWIFLLPFQVWFQNKRSKERRMKQMTTGMIAGRGFFPPGKGGRRGFPLIGEEFGFYGPHDKPPFPHDFGYPPNFPPHHDGFFPGPMGLMGKFFLNDAVGIVPVVFESILFVSTHVVF